MPRDALRRAAHGKMGTAKNICSTSVVNVSYIGAIDNLSACRRFAMLMTLAARTRLLGCTFLMLFAATACTTIDPYTREKKVSKTTKGAAIGAGAGAVVGWISGSNSKERKRRALLGAGLGGLTGGAIGYYMDRQEAKLRQRLEGTGVSVTRNGDDITLNMPSNVTFATDRAELNANFYEVLNSVGLVLKEYNKTIVEVAGHTDNTGDAAYNQSLSDRRSQSVAQYLQTRGVSSERIVTIGGGEKHPVASNDSASGRQQNRRVELTLTPLKQG
jgi:outer membrane protein OmpA-like peptidoglycan-associated protein